MKDAGVGIVMHTRFKPYQNEVKQIKSTSDGVEVFLSRNTHRTLFCCTADGTWDRPDSTEAVIHSERPKRSDVPSTE